MDTKDACAEKYIHCQLRGAECELRRSLILLLRLVINGLALGLASGLASEL